MIVAMHVTKAPNVTCNVNLSLIHSHTTGHRVRGVRRRYRAKLCHQKTVSSFSKCDARETRLPRVQAYETRQS